MFYDADKVGDLAVCKRDLHAGRPTTLFKVLVATAMFQRRQDVQIMRILRGLPRTEAREIGSLHRLLSFATESVCEHLASNGQLIDACDLKKVAITKAGDCDHRPGAPCHLKRHTEVLKRYGHFGKVPTSIALSIRDAGARDLRHLWRLVVRESHSALDASERLEQALSRAWRVNQKIACMFLSAVSNPDLGDDAAPWVAELDWNHFVVVDSNVDLFLAAIGYDGLGTYNARRAFIQSLADRVDLRDLDARLPRVNARLVQQAMFLFMSSSNRRALLADCLHRRPQSCSSCSPALRSICPERVQ